MAEGKNKISIIVPVYNEKRYLKACVNSLVTQQYSNIEIILVDDGSTDGTGDDCDKLAATDERIKVIHKKNGGLSEARITGLSKACGEWIMFVDDDDLLSPLACKVLIDHYLKHTEVDIVTGGRLDGSVDTDIWDKDEYADSDVMTGEEVCERIPEDGQKTIITPLWGKIYRKRFLDELDLGKYKDVCPTIYFEDVLMTPMLYSYANKVCVVHKPIYFHRTVMTSISLSGKLTSFYYEQIKSGDILLEFSKEHQLKNYYQYQLGIYIDSILRIYCLADEEHFEKYSNDIIQKYKKYYHDYIKMCKVSMAQKLLRGMFAFSHKLWKVIVKKYYFKA